MRGLKIPFPLRLSPIHVQSEAPRDRMAYALLDGLQWNADGVKHCDVEMPEGVKPCLRDFQRHEQRRHLPTTVRCIRGRADTVLPFLFGMGRISVRDDYREWPVNLSITHGIR